MDTFLVAPSLDADPAPLALEDKRRIAVFPSVHNLRRRLVHDPEVVVAAAAGGRAAVANPEGRGDVCAEGLRGGPEVVDVVAGEGGQLAGGNHVASVGEHAGGVRGVVGVVEDEVGGGVGVGVEVEVGVLGEHQCWGLSVCLIVGQEGGKLVQSIRTG